MDKKLHLPRVWKLIMLVILLSNCVCPISIPVWRAKRLSLESNIASEESKVTSDRSRRSEDQSGSNSNSDSSETECGDPGIPENGSRVGSSFHVGAELIYACKPGFILRGSEVLTCKIGNRDDEPYWDARVPRCTEPAECRDYGSIPNGERIIEGTREGDIVIFRCNEDYDLLGNQQLVCGSNGYWSAAWPVCRKSPANCGDPGLPSNCHRLVEGTTESSTVEYSCLEGYALLGNSTRTCMSDSAWSGSLPTCQMVNCGTPESPAQGSTEYTLTEYGAKAKYLCNTGYVLSGAKSAVCTLDGTWSFPPPTCNMVECSPLHSPANGDVNTTVLMTYSSTANYSCDHGYGLVGSHTRTCQADGTWSGSPPRCKNGRCNTLEAPDNGRVIINHLFPGGVARYSCNSGYVLSGSIQRICRHRGQWSGSTPTCKPIKCASLKPPRHGSVMVTDGNNFNSVATYTCDHGFELLGDSARFCQSTRIWTGRPPGCYEIKCGVLSAPHSGSVRLNGTTLWSEAVYSCDPGYVLRFGDQIRTCIKRGVWSGKEPCCIREDRMCPDLVPPKNGNVEFTTKVGDTATYTCDDRYTLSGDSTRLCLPGGMWNGSDPVCNLEPFETPICGNLTDPENGMVEIDDAFTLANYSCDEGFQLMGPMFRNCQIDGNWTGEAPTCVLVDCGPLPAPAGGAVDLTNGTTFGSVAMYSCNVGHCLKGNVNRICLSSGQWSDNEPVCQLVDCGSLDSPDNGTVDLSNGTTFGSTAVYSCDEVFELVGNSTRVCLESGTWSDEAPLCNIIDCGPLLPPLNGQIMIDATVRGSVAEYDCNAGYVIDGPQTRTCQSNSLWTGFDPVCEPIDCGFLDSPVNGDVALLDTTLGSEANYSCDRLFRLIGPETRICMENGEWSLNEPICEPFQCPELFNITNGAVEVSSRIPGSVATYTCDFGFQLEGNAQRECMENETWTGEEPSCAQITCPDLENPINGIVDIQGNTPGGSAIYRCNPGLSLIGTSQQTCNVDGTWSGEPPTCQLLLCPVLTPPENGDVFVSGQTVNSIATYICNEGFLSELLVRSCLDNGEWSGFDPMCLRNECDPEELTNPTNGMVTFDSVTIGSIATYTCDRAYELVGNDMRVCMRNGAVTSWVGAEPTCELILCPELLLVNGRIIQPSRTVGSLSVHQCNNGFTLVGAVTRQCTRSGEWSGSPPTCTRDAGTTACPALDAPSNGNIDITVTTPGATVTYSCSSGYMLNGPMTRTCLDNGLWSGSDTTCDPIDCGTLLAPSNGRVMFQPTPVSTTLSSIATYFCFEGFRIVGSPIRVCLQNGVWSGSMPSCILVNCGALANPVNGLVDTSGGTTFGTTATYSCNLNFMLMGSSTRSCTVAGVWGGQPPTCIPIEGNTDIDCGDPGTPLNGGRSLISTIEDSVVTYTCNEAFMLEGDAMRTCQSNEQWSGELPRCVPVMCPILADPDNATIFVTGRTVGSQATYICSSGFVIREGDVIIRNCQSNGEWSNTEPRCIPRPTFTCPLLSNPTNGEVTVSGLSVGSIATFSCNTGYVLSGSPVLQCGERGIWNTSDPTCERIQCPDPGMPSDGRRILNDFRAGSIVFFVCNDGFEIVGEQILQCLETGMWSSDTPTCVEIDRSTTLTGTVMDQYGRICNVVNGQLESCCRYRQDWASLTDEEKSRYIDTVKMVSMDPLYSQLYNELISRHKRSFTTDIQLLNASISQFIPWHRYFLLEYETLLRFVDPNITIPYWDWTIRPMDIYSESIFDPNLGFGNSANETSLCVSSGPFQKGEFEVTPSAGGGCLMREYLDAFRLPTRTLIEDQFLQIPANMFDDFHNAIFQFVNLMVRCIVGGDMCSVDAANDPLYLLQLARVDLIVDRWQSMNEEKANVRYANDATPLQLTFDGTLKVLNFSTIKELPYGVCIQYGALREVEEATTDPTVTGSLTGQPGVGTGSLETGLLNSPRPRQKRHGIDCSSEEEIDKLNISVQERNGLRKRCGYSKG